MSDIQFEICANSVRSAIEAQRGGAYRVELCENIPEGGTTPSAGAILAARKALSIKLNVIIRPRGGDFLYSDEEFEIMKHDIAFCKQVKVDGVVFGVLNTEGAVDIQRNIALVELARPMTVTFHRAFDVTNNIDKALEDIINIGFNVVLTSGGFVKAIEGKEVIKRLVEKAGNQIVIMPGSGISEANIKDIIASTGARFYHLSARRPYPSEMQFRKKIPMGSLSEDEEWNRKYTDAEIVRSVIKASQRD